MAVRAYNTITLIRVDDAVWEIIDGYWHKNGVNQEIKAQGEDGLDGLSAYEVAVIGGYTGTETEFYNELAMIEGIGAVKTTVTENRQFITDYGTRISSVETTTGNLNSRVSTNETNITSMGITITTNTVVDGLPVSHHVSGVLDDMQAMTNRMDAFEQGGGNMVRNPSLGQPDDPDSYWWSDGNTWIELKARGVTWNAVKMAGKTWNNAKEGLI